MRGERERETKRERERDDGGREMMETVDGGDNGDDGDKGETTGTTGNDLGVVVLHHGRRVGRGARVHPLADAADDLQVGLGEHHLGSTLKLILVLMIILIITKRIIVIIIGR